jgi:hypothetical protein
MYTLRDSAEEQPIVTMPPSTNSVTIGSQTIAVSTSGAISSIPATNIDQPVIAELLSNPAPENYLDYLRFKLHRIACGKNVGKAPTPADVQKNTFSDDR